MKAHLCDKLRREPWWSEWWSAWAAIVWAKWIYWEPAELTARGPYLALGFVGPDALWEWFGFVIGLFQIAAVIIDWRGLRFAAATAAAAFWLVVAYGVWLSEKSAPGAAVYFILGLASMNSMRLLFRPAAAE